MGKLQQIERRAAEKGFFKFLFLRIAQLPGVIREKLDNLIAKFTRWRISKKTPIQKNKVVFMHYDNKYQCNPSYICNEILRQGLDWELVYVVWKKNPAECPKGVRVVKRNTLEHFYEMASAKIWVDNAVCFPWEPVPKKDGQYYINTWHGSMGLKRIDKDRIVSKKWAQAAQLASEQVDYMISNSAFETEVYRTTYWPDEKTKVMEFGHPRNDILFADDAAKQQIKEKVCKFYRVSTDCHFILYAPTFRDSKNIKYYDVDYERLIEAATKRFGGEWKVINRFHFKVKKLLDQVPEIKENPNILDGNSYEDIQELMTVCDIGITDYSSWICDYVLTNNFGFIYANDLDEYDNERGFYYPLDSTPFPIATNNDEMYDNIVNFNTDKYAEKKAQFLSDRGCKETGNASKQVVELMKEIIENK
ncbi:MAG: CDP-glycerol glycerophosphotransferase family protein [Ruminococcus sp.]|nr:CDP-glycerol glycerophosphotransferase family protein [Ruminococcus sp.]